VTPEATARFRRGTALAAIAWALCSLGLAIYGQLRTGRNVEPPLHTSLLGTVAIVTEVSPAAARAGVSPGDRVHDVDGLPVQEWYRERGWSAIRAGQAIRYSIETTQGEWLDLELLPSGKRSLYQRFLVPVFAALSVVGLTFMLVGAFVWRMKPGRAESWAFLLFSAAAATTLFGAVHSYDAPFGSERMTVNLPLLGATMFHLFTVFPSEPPWIARRRRLRLLPYAVAALVACLVLFASLSGRNIPWLYPLSFGLVFFWSFAAVSVLIRERMRMRGSALTQAADIILAGVVTSFLPVTLLLLGRLVVPVSFPLSVAMLWFVVFPLAVALGIVRGQLFEVRGISGSSAAYGFATLVITGLFAGLITFADAAFQRFNESAHSPWFSVVFLFFAILAFNPLRNRLQSLVDRIFDRDRAGYRTAVREISEAMVSMLSLAEISERLVGAAIDTLGVERTMVLLLSDDEQELQPAAWRGEWEADALQLKLRIDHPVGKHLWMRRQELSRQDFDEAPEAEIREAGWEIFDALDVRLLVPILFGVDLLGVIAVGAKLSGERVGPDDRQLLRTLANQSAIAIENAQAFDEIAKLNETLEARVEERTSELQQTQAQLMQSEKMRSLGQLVAGVAHELNNPIGFVHANLQLLDDYIGRLVVAQEQGGDAELPEQAVTKLLARSREGTERVKKIVLDLRTFSRMDQAELSDADLNEELQRTLGLMEPRFKGGLRVVCELNALPPVRCYPAQLNQVFMNLMMNACDAMGSSGTLRIRSEPGPLGVRLVFRDDGPGIAPGVLERIFEPFFTTKPVGQGTGLVLFISHGIVERHGGSLSVEAPREGGAIFRIDLPLVASPPEEGGAGPA